MEGLCYKMLINLSFLFEVNRSKLFESLEFSNPEG